MRRKFKKILAAVIMICITLTIVPQSSIVAKAASADEAISWVQSQVGKAIDYDGVYGAQCVDLIKAYYHYLGVSPVGGNGCDYATNALPAGWTRIQGAVPQKGDILVYSANSSNPYGHVAIFESTTVTYHQNFNAQQYVQKVTGIAYNGFGNSYWGVIRPNFGAGSQVSLSFINDDCQVDTSNAFVYTKAQASIRGTFTEAGITIWDAAGNVVASKTEYISTSSSYLEIWYNVTDELGVTLNSGSYYKYQFYTVFNGTRYNAEVKDFWTSGTRQVPLERIWLNNSVQPLLTGESYTLSVSYEPANTTEDKTVSWQSSDPAVATVENGIVKAVNPGTAVITAKMGNKSATCTVKVSRFPFVDVKSGDWYYGAVRYVYNHQFMTGLSDTVFRPNDSLVRAQFAVILHRMNGAPSMTYVDQFPDVGADIWYTEAILWASHAKVVTGYTATGLFGPNDKITREQMAVMMYRYADYMNYDTSMRADFSKFSDASKVSGFADEAMQWAVGNGIISGKDNGTVLDPQGDATRAECATIIMRFIEKISY